MRGRSDDRWHGSAPDQGRPGGDWGGRTHGDALAARSSGTARRRYAPVLLVALGLLLTACVTRPPIASPSPLRAVATAEAPTAAPVATMTAVGGAPVGSPTSAGVSAARAPIFYYRGRVYWQLDFGRAEAADGLQAGQPIDTTFSRWQSNGLAPAGTAIHDVVGQPVDRMLAVRARGRFAFFRAEDRPSGLDGIQVVQGTVQSFGPGRWTTPDGLPPPAGQQPSAPDFVHATIYTPATVAVERTLQGGIPPGTTIEVRQVGGPIPLAPGGAVILLLAPGQWARGGPGGSIPPGDYYHLWPGRAYAVERGQVLPLGEPDADGERVPLDRFLSGLAETFTGVTPLDPHGPAPTPAPPAPLPTPAPTPTPRVPAGRQINLVRERRLAGTHALFLKGPTIPPGRDTVTDPARIAALVGTLDRPLTVLPGVPDSPQSEPEQHDQIIIYFRSAEDPFDNGPTVILEYRRAAGTLTDRTDPAQPYTVPAPPEFVQRLGLE